MGEPEERWGKFIYTYERVCFPSFPSLSSKNTTAFLGQGLPDSVL